MPQIKDHLPIAFEAFEIPNYISCGGGHNNMDYTPDTEVESVIQRCFLASDFVVNGSTGLRVWCDFNGELYGKEKKVGPSFQLDPGWISVSDVSIKTSDDTLILQDQLSQVWVGAVSNGYVVQIEVGSHHLSSYSLEHACKVLNASGVLNSEHWKVLRRMQSMHDFMFGRCILRGLKVGDYPIWELFDDNGNFRLRYKLVVPGRVRYTLRDPDEAFLKANPQLPPAIKDEIKHDMIIKRL